jgi:hypothetical protein
MTTVEEGPDLTELQRRGMESAARVFDRLMEQVEDLRVTRPRPARGLDGVDGETGPAPGLHQVRAAAAAAIDGYAELFQRTFELYADLVETSARRDGGTADRPTVELAGPPGACAATTVWAHNSTDAPAADVTLRLTDLTAHDGTVIRAATSTFEPGRLSIEQGQSASSWLSVTIPAEAPEGVYYGHVLATGLPRAHAPIRLVVGR